MELLIIFVIGALVGGILTGFVRRSESIGTLRLDTSDPDDNPYLFLELDSDVSLDTIRHSKHVTFDVNLKSFIPHE